MNFSGPKQTTWWLALIIWIGVIMGVLGILSYLLPISALYDIAFWLLAIGFVIVASAAGATFWVMGNRGK